MLIKRLWHHQTVVHMTDMTILAICFFALSFVCPKWRIQLLSVWICCWWLALHCLFIPSMVVDVAVVDSTACVFIQFQFLSITFVTFHHHSTAVYSIRQHKNQAEILDCYIFVALCHSLCKLINEMGKFKNLQLHRECHQRIQNILYFAWNLLCFHTVCVYVWVRAYFDLKCPLLRLLVGTHNSNRIKLNSIGCQIQ